VRVVSQRWEGMIVADALIKEGTRTQKDADGWIGRMVGLRRRRRVLIGARAGRV